jgi:serine/threonine protein kinase
MVSEEGSMDVHATDDRWSGRTISHYRIERKLGAGGMGQVFLATDVALGRPAALKILPDAFSPALRERLFREAWASARLQHPAIATFFEAGESDDVAFIAMEYVAGRTLRDEIGTGPISFDRAISLVCCLLEALSHAHAAEILHRDIKPANIMCTESGAAKLLDFGLAKHAVGSKPASTDARVAATTTAKPSRLARDEATELYLPDLAQIGSQYSYFAASFDLIGCRFARDAAERKARRLRALELGQRALQITPHACWPCLAVGWVHLVDYL